MLKIASLIIVSTVLLACQTAPIQKQKTDVEFEDTTPKLAKPFPEPEAGTQQLNKDLLLDYLVGEIGARAGNLNYALQRYLRAAEQAKDAYAAERAARIAMHLEDSPATLQATRLWIKYAPNTPAARQFAGIVYLREANMPAAAQQFEALLKIMQAQDAWLSIAGVLSQEKDTLAAQQLMQTLVNAHVDEAEAHYALALVQVAQKQIIPAEQSLHKAIQLQAGWALPHVLLAQIMVGQERKAEAIEYLEKKVEEYPDDYLLRHSYARQLVEVQRFPEAVQAFRLLHQAKPENKDIQYALAILETQQKHWVEARKLWQKLRAEARFYVDASYFLGQVEEFSGNKTLAIGLYNNVDRGEHMLDAAIQGARLLVEQGRLVEMRERMRNLREQNDQQAIQLYVAEAEIMQNHVGEEEALLVYQEALRAYPNNVELLYNRGLYYVDIERYAEMEADFKKVIMLDENHADAWNALGYTLADRNVRLNEAWDYIQRAIQLKPDSAAILDSLGWVYYRKGELKQAEAYLRKALDKVHDEEIAAHLGEVLWVIGQQDEARKVWREALEKKPDSKFIVPVLKSLGVDL
jgi:tetratricopeptide (TPR) repeat protein